ncbi:ATP-dependent Clp protease adaptor ClpS [Humisphaera borealis]|uniref:ATP-dependent Clp protease adaptor ClpS n=1 Tax=Humisphaera borealis TaxID=2807512 RepID=A0A7M2X3Y6_9BACT|nr:ATP-dependent Clp protease adaptor ClpS [Humisphaera borealis]QOV91741.1 ATP-dependent Clp protease adaptor ClpS [Humisphaera borealis]
MAEKSKQDEKESAGGDKGGSTATVAPKSKTKPTPRKNPPGLLPLWKVLLHNDDKNNVVFVIETIVELTPLNVQDAEERTVEAHKSGVSLLLTTHKERAELYQEQFTSKGLTVTIEPAK